MLTKQEAKLMHEHALKILQKEFAGAKITLAGGTLGETLKLSFNFVVGTPEEQAASARATWERHCGSLILYGEKLTPQDFGAKFTFRGRTFTISGAAPNKPKYCVKATRDDGKTFVFPAEQTVKALAQYRAAHMPTRAKLARATLNNKGA